MGAVLTSAIKRFEPLHRVAGQARWYFNRHVRFAPLALKVEIALRRHRQLTFDIGGNIGLGAILSHAAFALRVGTDRGVDVSLRFTSPVYRPSGGPDDWIDCYFERRQAGLESLPTIDSSGLRFDYNTGRDHPLLWSYLTIRSNLKEAAATLTGNDPFASVHYRGSDKFMEQKRVREDEVLSIVERQMRDRNLARLFVASDESAFIEQAKARFGDAVFWLPCEAMASGSKAAHFSNIDGAVKAREALITMVALSRSDICVRTPSFLSDWAMTLTNSDTILVK